MTHFASEEMSWKQKTREFIPQQQILMIRSQNTVVFIAHKRLKDAATATRCVLRPIGASKCVCDRGSVPGAAGKLKALSRLPSWIWWRGNGEGGMKRLGKEREQKGRKGRGRTGRRDGI